MNMRKLSINKDVYKRQVLISHEFSGIGQESIFISQTKGNIIGWLKAEPGPFQIGGFQKCKAVILFYRVCC